MEDLTCVYRSPRPFQLSADGNHPPIYRCAGGMECCTLRPSDQRTKGGPIADCLCCAKRESLPVVELVDCVHRGEKIRSQKADLCGLIGTEFDVFACAIHGECSERRMCKKQTVHPCSTCKEIKLKTGGPTGLGSNEDESTNYPSDPENPKSGDV